MRSKYSTYLPENRGILPNIVKRISNLLIGCIFHSTIKFIVSLLVLSLSFNVTNLFVKFCRVIFKKLPKDISGRQIFFFFLQDWRSGFYFVVIC